MKISLRFAYPIFAIAFTLSIYFILFVTAFDVACYADPSYYKKEFVKYNVEKTLEDYREEHIPLSDLENVMQETLRYLRGKRENLLISVQVNGQTDNFYREDEASHMADVRNLFLKALTLRTMCALTALAILFFLLILEHGKAFFILGKGFLLSSAALLLGLLLFSLYAASHFDTAFTTFHLLFFSQGNWEFDPALSRMIDILPEAFFQDTAFRILLYFLSALLPSLLLSFFFMKKGRVWGYPEE